VPEYHGENFILTSMNTQGNPDYRLVADAMVHYLDDDTSEFSRPRLFFYRPGEPPWRISAASGWASDRGETVRLLGEVHIERDASSNHTAIKIDTRDLMVRPREHYAETMHAATLLSAGLRVDAVGVRAYIDREQIELLSHVHSRYEIPESKRSGVADATLRGTWRRDSALHGPGPAH
jgi:Uncharacterized protein conserved in bacteria